MDERYVRSEVARLVEKFSGFSQCIHTEKYDDEFLTGEIIKMQARDVLYLYFEVCDFFQVSIPENEINSYGLHSIRSITNCILYLTGGEKK